MFSLYLKKKNLNYRYYFFLIGLLSVLSAGLLSGCVDQAPQANTEQELEQDQEVESDQEIESDQELEIDSGEMPEIDQAIDLSMEPCNDDNPCSVGICEEGECVLECEDANDCSGRFEDCRQGVCYNRCFGPGTCFRGGVCVNGIWIEEEWAEDSDCPSDRICRGQLCVYPEPCESDDECNSWERCLEGNCEDLRSCGGDLNCADAS